jgi:hypothetical protein
MRARRDIRGCTRIPESDMTAQRGLNVIPRTG